MKTKITFAYPVTNASPDHIHAVFIAAGLNVVISAIDISGSIITITGDRLLTAGEKTTLRAALYATFPIIEDAE